MTAAITGPKLEIPPSTSTIAPSSAPDVERTPRPAHQKNIPATRRRVGKTVCAMFLWRRVVARRDGFGGVLKLLLHVGTHRDGAVGNSRRAFCRQPRVLRVPHQLRPHFFRQPA